MALTIDKIKNINIPINVSRKPDNYPPSTRGISLYNDSVNLYDAISLLMASAPPATFNIGEGLLGNGSVVSPLSWAGVNHTAALSGNGSVGSPLDVANKGITLSKLAQSGATLNQIIKWDGTNWVPANETGGATSFVPLSRELTINGVTYDLSQNRSWTIGSTAYPSAGIPVSTGSAWGTSIVNNSTNWNTAFSWGNHATQGYLTSAAIGVTVQPYNANTVIDGSYVHTDNNYTTAEKSKLAGIQAGAEVNVNADWNAVSGDAQILNKPSIPLVDSVPTSGSTNAVSSGSVFTALSFKADLVGGKVPAIQLPSYVDDVLEGYYNGTSFFIDSTFSTIMTPETGKIYINLLNNTSYRYTGSVYVQISNTVSSLNDLTDVTIGTLNNGQILQYNGTTSQWENVSVTIGSGDMQKSVYDIDNDGVVDYAETIAVDVRNNSSSDTLYRGTIVYLSGSTGTHPNAVKAQANSEATSSGTFGVVINDISPNSSGLVAAMGTLHNLDTRTGANGNPNPFTSDTLLDGDVLWLDPNTAGYVTKTKPSAPNHAVFIGVVARTHPTSGRIVYKIQNGYEVEELHNVKITSPLVNNQVLRYNDSNSLWENKTLNFQVPLTLNTTPSSGASTLAGDGTLTIPNYTLSGLGGVPTTRTLTINGTSYDLSADRSWTVSTASALDDLTDVVVSSPTSGQVLSYNGTNWVNTTGGGGGGTPGGSTTQVQFNDAGSFGGASGFTYDKTAFTNTGRLNIGAPSTPTGRLNVKGGGSDGTTSTQIWTNSGNTELMRLRDDGNLGIGTSSPGAALQVSSTTGAIFQRNSSNIAAPAIIFRKSRGTETSPTAVVSGDLLGAFNFSGYMPNSAYSADYALFGAQCGASPGTNSLPTNIFFKAGSSESPYNCQFYIHYLGNSRFGSQPFASGTLPTPNAKLEVIGANTTSGVGAFLVQDGATTPNSLFRIDNDGLITFGSGARYSGGNLLIGTTSASARLHVRGSDDLSTSSAFLVQNNATTPANLLDIRNNGAIFIGKNNVTSTQNTASIQSAGADADIGIAIVPKGTGAITAAIPDGLSTGGNARGAYAVDLQTDRSAATNVASGDRSGIIWGRRNTASGLYSFASGTENSASGTSSIAIGSQCTATATASFAVNASNISSGAYSSSFGFNSRAYLYGQSSSASGVISVTGDAQSSRLTARRSITGTAAAELTLDGAAPSSTGRLTPTLTGTTNGRLWNAIVQLSAICTTAGGTVTVGEAFIGTYNLGIKRIGATTSIVGTVQNMITAQADANMSSSVVTITADDTTNNESLKIDFTPPTGANASTVIRVVATVYLTEVGY